MKIGKKGDFTNRALGIILACLVILLFIVLVVKVYKTYRDEETKNAITALEEFVGKLNSLDEGFNGVLEIQGFKGRQNWAIVGWSQSDLSRPQKCALSSCLCICKYKVEDIADKSTIAKLSLSFKPVEHQISLKKDYLLKFANVCDGSNGFCRNLNYKDVFVDSFRYFTTYERENDLTKTINCESGFSPSHSLRPEGVSYIRIMLALNGVRVTKMGDTIKLFRFDADSCSNREEMVDKYRADEEKNKNAVY